MQVRFCNDMIIKKVCAELGIQTFFNRTNSNTPLFPRLRSVSSIY